MRPDDDPTWPSDDPFKVIREGRDTVDPGTRICVPVLPAHRIYAEVSVSPPINSYVVEVAIVVSEDEDSSVFGLPPDEKFLELGIITLQDKRAAITRMILSELDQLVGQECKSELHSFEQQRRVDEVLNGDFSSGRDAAFDLIELKWNLYINKRCTWCEQAHTTNQSALANYQGTLPDDFDGGTGATIRTPRGEDTMSQLRRRRRR